MGPCIHLCLSPQGLPSSLGGWAQARLEKACPSPQRWQEAPHKSVTKFQADAHMLFWLETQLFSVAVVRPDSQVIQWDRGLELVPPEGDDNIFFPVLPWRQGGNFSSPLYGANANAGLLSEYL